jgi:hypothetical protein
LLVGGIILSLAEQWFRIFLLLGYYCCCLIVGLFWLHHIQSLANVIMATIARNLLYIKKRHLGNDITMATRAVVCCRAKGPKDIAGFLVPLN